MVGVDRTLAGFEFGEVRVNDGYEFISEQAANACQTYGVKSISLRADKPT